MLRIFTLSVRCAPFAFPEQSPEKSPLLSALPFQAPLNERCVAIEYLEGYVVLRVVINLLRLNPDVRAFSHFLAENYEYRVVYKCRLSIHKN